MNKKKTNNSKTRELSKKEINRRRFLSLGIFTGLYGAGYAAWRWLYQQPGDGGILGGIQTPLRPVLDQNEKIFRFGYEQTQLAKIFPKKEALLKPRVNGAVGMDPDFANADWKLEVQKADGQNIHLSVDDLKELPRSEIVFDFKCIEVLASSSHDVGERV